MAFRRLVEGECGGSNSLVQLSSVVSRDASLNPQLAGPSRADQFVHEFANMQPAAQTFQMTALLNNIQQPEDSSRMDTWNKEFKQFNANPIHALPRQNHSSWNNGTIIAPRMMGARFPIYSNPTQAPGVQIQYLDEDQSQPPDVESLTRQMSKNILDVTESDDSDLAYSQFMSFMRQVNGGDASLGLQDQSTASATSGEAQLNALAEKYKEEWAKLSEGSDASAWLPHLSEKTNPFKEYSFAENNSMVENPDALTIGKERLKSGDVPGAVLCFEAAVARVPDSIEAWLLLGRSQAENEQDPQAIAALNKCVALSPNCLEAHMTLSASYTNENYTYLAYESLLNWLKGNAKYADLVPRDVNTLNMDGGSLSDFVRGLFIKAAQMSPTAVDADVQAALGVVFNLKQEYDKAVDCFRAALAARDDDAHLWNRLGATLANGERSEEAVEAYQRALSLEPGFLRARYNVGITCMNLGAHRQAAEHFLVALNQQASARGVDGAPSAAPKTDVVSSTIWSTLRMVCAFMDRFDLTPLVDARDLVGLNAHFDL